MTVAIPLAALALGAALASGCGPGAATPPMSTEGDMDRSALVRERSLVNDPEIVEARLEREGDDYWLVLRLRYANSCLADEGVTVFQHRAAAADWIEVRQRTPDEGCPDIHRPVEVTATTRIEERGRPFEVLGCTGSAAPSCRIVAAQAGERTIRAERVEIEPAKALPALPPVTDARVERGAASAGSMRAVLEFDVALPNGCRGQPVLEILESRLGTEGPVTEWARLSIDDAVDCDTAEAVSTQRIHAERVLRTDRARRLVLANPRSQGAEAPFVLDLTGSRHWHP